MRAGSGRRTAASISCARSAAALAVTRSCTSGTSTSWLPMVSAGFKEAMGS